MSATPIIHRLEQMVRLPARRKLLLLEAGTRLLWWRLLLALLPFRRIARRLERPRTGGCQPARAAADSGRAQDIGWAIAAAARNGPWPMHCLPQALAATAMLRARAIPATLYIGANPSQQGFAGHAWVVAAGVYVCGGQASAHMPVFTRYSC
ncbi:MAG: lasso peptide biosynthesis B2 protein [Salinisphaera sp.]|nr:lasso peptide biosynthesis B2 protein [Salinisphaera sp.]